MCLIAFFPFEKLDESENLFTNYNHIRDPHLWLGPLG